MEIENNSMDFGYSLGVLHHITKSQEGLNACVLKLNLARLFYYIFIILLKIGLFGTEYYGK